MNLFAWVNEALVQRLTSRFNLGTQPNDAATVWRLSKTVVPVTNVDDALSVEVVAVGVAASVTATGLVTLFTVPLTERWTIRFARAYVATGTFTMNGFYVDDNAASPNETLIKSWSPGIADALIGTTDKDFVMLAGWKLRVNVDTKALNGTMGITYYYKKERLY